MFELFVNSDLIRQQMQDQVEMSTSNDPDAKPAASAFPVQGRRLANRPDPPVHAASYRTYGPGPSTPS